MKLYNAITDRISSQYMVIHELILNLTEEKLNNKPSFNVWSIHDNIAHLTLYHQIFINRLQMMIENDGLQFDRYKPNEDLDFPSWQSMSTSELLINLDKNRKKLVNFISNLNEDQLEKSATHQKFGKMNVVEWIEFFLLHEAHHIYTIFKLIRN